MTPLHIPQPQTEITCRKPGPTKKAKSAYYESRHSLPNYLVVEPKTLKLLEHYRFTYEEARARAGSRQNAIATNVSFYERRTSSKVNLAEYES